MLNILYLVNKKTYLTKMSRVRFHGIEALSKIANVTMYGPGWQLYEEKQSVEYNIKKLNKNFELVIAYKPLDLVKFGEINIPKCLRYNEMYDKKWTQREILKSNANLVICHHLNEMNNYNIENVKFEYIGHCANKNVFKNYNQPKEYDFMLVGCINQHYPLRLKVKQIFEKLKKKGYKCYIHPHPGYNLNDAHTNKYMIEMAKKISKTKICITCSGVPRTRFGKYIEIPMCGSAICGDIPLDKADNYEYTIKIDTSMNENEIINILEKHIKNNELRLDHIKRGLEFSKNYTQEKYAERLLDIIKNFLNK